MRHNEVVTALEKRVAAVRAEYGSCTVGDCYTEIWQYVKNLRQDFAPGKPGDPAWKEKLLSIAAIAIYGVETATEWVGDHKCA
jgi:hypothetical protein